MAISDSTVTALEAAIEAAVADGTWRTQSVTIGDQTTTLVTLDQAIAFLGKIRAQAPSAVRSRQAAFRKGV